MLASTTGPTFLAFAAIRGAVDGLVYAAVVPRAVFLISTQLRQHPLARLFFAGIEVARTQDEGPREGNESALEARLQVLSSRGELFVFPESTSSLGPRHLPFKSGAAHLAEEAISAGVPLQIVPLGIHYECAWGFRSQVEVVVGNTIGQRPPATASPLERLRFVKRSLERGLEEVGLNVSSAEQQEWVQRLAYVSTLSTARSYFRSLKALEPAIPGSIQEAWERLETDLTGRRRLRHQGVPLFPMGPVVLDALWLLLSGSVVLAAVLINLPPFLAIRWVRLVPAKFSSQNPA